MFDRANKTQRQRERERERELYRNQFSPQPQTEMSTKEFPLGGKLQTARRADIYAVLVVPNVKIWLEGQNSIPALGLHELLRVSFNLLGTFEKFAKSDY